ncbi:hybrid sensor histidine kinase/response regulator [Proteobacteria bacterium 005FR1]|nr:hybrid sensor histidine kinase/response regulator [Proteobacteria bacterium 005FR1]
MDITERKEADRRKEEFLAILAHELRNPLAPLRNSLEILRVGREDPRIVDKTIGSMDHQLKHIVLLVNDLLDNTRIRHGKLLLRKDRIRVADLIAQAVEVSEGLVRERQNQLVVSAVPSDVYVDAGLMRLVQALANLLNNAAKFTGPDGTIWLSVHDNTSEVVISVRDNGIGIAAEKLPHLFTMFSQATPPLERGHGGLGVGLSLVRGLIELHGGTVEARSEGLNQGAEFIVRLPTAAPPVEEAKPAERAEFVHDLRILVVDDNRESAISLATLLDLTGNDARCVFDGDTALQIAEEFRPDVIFLDLGMPVLNRYEVARRIRQQPWGQDVLIVANSGWGQERDRQRSTEAGFDYHLVKPVEFAAVQEVLRARVDRIHD